MKLALGQLRLLVAEAKRKRHGSVPSASRHHPTATYMRNDVLPWLREFIDQAADDLETFDPFVFRAALNKNDIRFEVADDIAGWVEHLVNAKLRGDDASKLQYLEERIEDAGRRTSRKRGTWNVYLAVGRNEDSSVRYDKTEVWVAPDLSVSTLDHKPIWVFDPETLSTERVATTSDCEYKNHGFVPCAELSVIESGKI